MGLRLEVLKWEDHTGKGICQRMPPQGMADLKLGARCIVQESQSAIFFRNGKALDVMGPGNHTLSTENIPIISNFFKLAYQDAPFQSSVYFVSTKPVRDLKWGTKEPITLRDTDFGFVRVRAFGKFSVRVTDPGMFVNTVVGTEGRHDAKDIERWFKDVILQSFSDLLATQMQGKSVLDVQNMKGAIGTAVKAKTRESFEKYGIELYDFILASINLPEKVQQAIDERGAMGALGNMQQYMQYKTAGAMEKAAGQPGSGMGQMMGAGMGMGMGMMMPGMMQQGMQQGHPQQPPPGYGYPPPGYPPPGYGYPPPGYPPPGYPPQHGHPQQGGYPPPGYGYPPQQGGQPPHGQPPQQGGHPPQQGQPPQGQPPQGHPPQGHPPQGGYPPPGYPPQGHPPQGYPPQGQPPQQPPQGEAPPPAE